ncbi:hypothetical protein CDL12_28170 [Handroanthus impetiginosus]|uniref:Uncharacterized protein n=1 Tax=Handroanthus impetiginosus TaxID=429701 RepID=A0A2G9G1Z4_9LAMI|nr:hypothetical protein CDL12_28170 [Handroanthus impetiginosus]
MLHNCPNHSIWRHIQVHTFYHGLIDRGKDKLNHLKGDSLFETIAKMPQSTKQACPHSVESIHYDSKAQCQAVTRCNGRELQEVTKEIVQAKEKEVSFEEKEKEVKVPLEKFLEVFKKLHINTTFVEALKALCDLGVSINLMPYLIYRTPGLGEAKPTSFTLQLANRPLTYPNGVIEDIFIKVDKFIFPTDFVVLDMEADSEIPTIHGKPFLATGRTLIDVQKGELTMRVKDQQITFNVFKTMRFPNESDECFSINVIGNLAEKEAIVERPMDPFKRVLLELADKDNEEDLEVIKTLDLSKNLKSKGVEPLKITAPSKVLTTSIEELLMLELKPLLNQFRCA